MFKVDVNTGEPYPNWPVVFNNLTADNVDWIDPSDTANLKPNATHERPVFDSRLHTQRTGE